VLKGIKKYAIQTTQNKSETVKAKIKPKYS
jgi:hypothetical protein